MQLNTSASVEKVANLKRIVAPLNDAADHPIEKHQILICIAQYVIGRNHVATNKGYRGRHGEFVGLDQLSMGGKAVFNALAFAGQVLLNCLAIAPGH